MRWSRLIFLAAWLWAAASGSAFAQADPPLVRAHDLYNKQLYDLAIRSAIEARKIPAQANAASIVLARAHLERYRQRMAAEDLDAARSVLTPIDNAQLTGRDRLDWTIATGQLLYFDRRFGTAAEFFETALAQAEQLEAGARDRLIEWWATALDQQAQLGPQVERHAIYRRVLARAEEELRRDDRSTVAAYWLAAAAVGVDDLDRAWAAAEAGWLRASASTGPAGTALRNDLDRLVTQVIIPQRSGHLSPSNPSQAMAVLQQEWTTMKERYAKP
jgi:tetratricopeptide (TPR) repeat protein